MSNVMSFSQNENSKFTRCPKCYREGYHKKIGKKDLDFGEILNKAIHER